MNAIDLFWFVIVTALASIASVFGYSWGGWFGALVFYVVACFLILLTLVVVSEASTRTHQTRKK